ncbi:MAG: hypothetical protein ACHP84_10410 [Caulobacterales bacterium]|jgi:hypothetical protein
MITFNVVKEQNGWAVHLRDCMTAPFRLKASAIKEAERMADDLRRHGECVEVVIGPAGPGETAGGSTVEAGSRRPASPKQAKTPPRVF